MPTSQGDAASTVRHEPSLIDMTISKPRSISTTVCLTRPWSSTRAAPWVRLARPEAIAASWSAFGRSSRSETATGSPSAETTIAWATEGIWFAKLPMSQLRSRASALSCGIGDPGATRSSRSEEAVGPLARMQAADQATGIRPLAAGQHTPTSSESTTSSSTWLLRYLGSRCAETTQPGYGGRLGRSRYSTCWSCTAGDRQDRRRCTSSLSWPDEQPSERRQAVRPSGSGLQEGPMVAAQGKGNPNTEGPSYLRAAEVAA